MSEIKTYRCDICKKTYHSDEVVLEALIAVKGVTENDGEVTTSHEHICPCCAIKLYKFVKDPDEIEKVKLERSDARGNYNALGKYIHDLRDSILGWSINSWPCIEKYREMLDDVLFEHKRVSKSRDMWRSIAVVISIAYIIVTVVTITNIT